MATISSQRDLVAALKRETCLNVGILSKLHPMPAELSRQIFKDNCLEKPTQNMFNHLSYYLVCIIDPPASAALPWPLYDTKTEKLYRTGFSNFLNGYSSKGLLSPVMSSYLVNPGCYKVTILIFQLSQLAVERVLTSKMKDRQKTLFIEMTTKYKSNEKEGFIENIESETERMLSKFSNYLYKRNITEKIAEILRKKITDIEERLSSTNAQKYIDNLVDKYLKENTVDDATKTEILDVKNVYKTSQFFENWLEKTDREIDELESEWERRISAFLEKSKETFDQTESLIARQTGEADKNTYMIEFNPTTDEISTENLQNEVNSEQKYILKNIVKNERLNFPNLIRGFLISICYVLRGTEIGDEIYRFNEYLSGGRRNYNEIVTSMRMLVERVMNAEARLQSTPVLFQQTLSAKDYAEIPPLPDLSDLKANREMQCEVLFDTFTPLSTYKHRFNLRKRPEENFIKPQPKSLLNMPYHGPKEDFFKSVISCRFSAYDRSNETQNFHNMSIISHAPSRVNETIAECSSGFTQQQLLRLLSTRKSSSSKKFKYKTERPDNIKIKKGNLFNESINSNESNLCRSYSSPNLYENRDKRPYVVSKGGRRKLSIMQEDSPSLLEVSGIASLERDSNYGTPEGLVNLESTRKLVDASSLPIISAMPSAERKINNILRDIEDDLNKEISHDIESPVLKEASIEEKIDRTETPKTNAQLVSKTSSLEKIINRFKKVRANIIPMDKAEDETNEFKTIVEEKENLNTVNVDVFTANKILLPDLLSPSCSTLTIKSTDYLDQLCFDIDDNAGKERRKPRESLGTALGVDQTFLDQFDLID